MNVIAPPPPSHRYFALSPQVSLRNEKQDGGKSNSAMDGDKHEKIGESSLSQNNPPPQGGYTDNESMAGAKGGDPTSVPFSFAST